MSFQVPPPAVLKQPINVPDKQLMGPGPSNVPDRVLQALSLPTLGHLHPEFCQIMDEVKAGIQYAFQTKNALTLAISATGHAAMEAVMVNMLEPQDTILIAENGIWGQRAGDMADRQRRYNDSSKGCPIGPVVKKLVKTPGVAFELEEIEAALDEHKPNVFFITHGESSTGVLQNLEGIGKLCHSRGVIFAVDSVAALGGVTTNADELEIDVIYTGSQKVLGVPPGLAPISFSDRAVAKIQGRKTPISSFYLDMNWLGEYWNCYPGKPRVYHHTGPTNSMYGLREGLALLAEEGLENVVRRHRLAADHLHAGLEKMGLELFVADPKHRLPTVTTIKVPQNVDWKAVTVHAMKNHLVEISGGLGPTAGKVWRIGVMGHNASIEKVDKALKAFDEALRAVRGNINSNL